MSTSKKRSRVIGTLATLAIASLALAGCATTKDPASGGDSGGDKGSTSANLKIGTTDRIVSMDPAASYDNGSFMMQINVFPFLMSMPYGEPEVKPDIAESAEFSDPNTYTVKLKEGLKFANGNALTSSDVKFSFDRLLTIKDDEGPWSLLENMASVEAPDDLTVHFKLNSPNDQLWPQVLSSPAGMILDEDVFSATEVTPSDVIIKEKAFAGPYVIDSYKENELITYSPNPEYKGMFPAKNTGATASYYTDETKLKLAIEKADVDVAFRSLSATDVDSLRGNDKVEVVEGPGGEQRYMVFNSKLMPFGSEQADADPAKALAVRKAMANIIDRDVIAERIFKGIYSPLYSPVPQGFLGATEPMKELYGTGQGGPDVEKAKMVLSDAGVTPPVALNIQYNPDHYGASSGDEYALIKTQLEESGLFTVTLSSTEWTTYSAERTTSYPIYQLGWFPDFSDADNYLSPFFLANNFLQTVDTSQALQDAVKAEAVEPDQAKREELLGIAQKLASEELWTLPMLQGKQVAVQVKGVKGVADTLDASFKFKYSALTK
ncbi:MAG: ABC transporter substrate-binding protein [Actinomycetaceae bacterium]|nr:ABC transporter substrate-binding protein [Actinomycetaceae bacterium]